MKRIVGLDVIKAISIILVLTIHSIGSMPFFPNTWWSNAFTILTVTCVPLFLMVNGALMLNKPFSRRKWQHRLVNLILITIVWKIILTFTCLLFWGDGAAVISPRELLVYVLGGNAPYGQIGYTWFLDFYIGWQVLFPLWKHLYDYKSGKYLTLLSVILIICGFGSDTLFMIVQPLGTILDKPNLSTVFSYLINYTPFAHDGMYLVYFFLGGLLFKRFYLEKETEGEHLFPYGTRQIYIAGLVSFLVLYVFNRYQSAFCGQRFDIAQKYSNIFTLILVSALFVYFISCSFNAGHIKSPFEFVGKRTFGIYIIQVLPMKIIGELVCNEQIVNGLIPNGSGMPPVVAMIYLEGIIVLAILASAVCVALIEHLPIIRRLLPS